MKFTLDSTDLLNGVFSVIKALPLRSSMPVLDGSLIEATEKGIHPPDQLRLTFWFVML